MKLVEDRRPTLASWPKRIYQWAELPQLFRPALEEWRGEGLPPGNVTYIPQVRQGVGEEEHAVSGVVNKLEDYLVLVVGDDYQVFDFAKDLKVDGINEGDEVTVVYTGTLGDEKTPPVVIEIAKN